jgi:hypothetical protein
MEIKSRYNTLDEALAVLSAHYRKCGIPITVYRAVECHVLSVNCADEQINATLRTFKEAEAAAEFLLSKKALPQKTEGDGSNRQ